MTASAASFDATDLGLSPPRLLAWPPRLAWLWLPALAAAVPEGFGAVRVIDATAGGADDGDAELVARACKGDSRAFEKLIRRHHAMIHRVAWRQTGLADEAEDIVQTVLMQLVEKLASYRGQARFTTWLIGITINACHDHRRRKSSFGRMRQALSSFVSVSGVAGDDGDLVRQSWLKSTLAGLSPELRATVVLVAGEGLSHREAAAELGISENTVSWRMHRVRKQLAEEAGHEAAAAGRKEIRDER
ncbi:RNA polymerase sigma factor [Labrys sp. KNU-23]|uniref:RNA polymerase sigma factor n=1 Tax=Labrys sp. KNU-23 TaxID=2789216 RepID=UPI0011EC6E95|nr:RNA polymerase sigma factor [Labrys sp. KNU-23]QEN87490.1 RNA polymerase sigma factor [Labrys sp. KNU-23]